MFDRNEVIMEGLVYTVMGLIIVFAILVIIMLVIKAMALFSGDNSGKGKKEKAVTEETQTSADKKDNNAIVAAITAAIAAILGKSVTGFRIRSYRKIQDGEWNKTGRREVLENRI